MRYLFQVAAINPYDGGDPHLFNVELNLDNKMSCSHLGIAYELIHGELRCFWDMPQQNNKEIQFNVLYLPCGPSGRGELILKDKNLDDEILSSIVQGKYNHSVTYFSGTNEPHHDSPHFQEPPCFLPRPTFSFGRF